MGVAAGGSRAKAARLYLVAGAVASATYFVLPRDELVHDLWYDAVGLSSAVAVFVGVRLWRPATPWAWYLIAAGLLSFVAGDVLWGVYELQGVEPFPSGADALYLAGYPFIAWGLVLLLRARTPGRDGARVLEAAAIITGATLVLWVFLIEPQIGDSSLPMLERVISVAYPVGDLILVAVVIRLAVGRWAASFAYRALIAGMVVLLGSDLLYAYLNLHGAYFAGHPLDAGYMASYVLLGAAALHPTMRALSVPAPPEDPRLTPIRLALLAAASLLAPAAMAVLALRAGSVNGYVIAAGSGVLFLLVLLRMRVLVREVSAKADALDRRGRELQDALTRLRAAEEERRALLEATIRAGERARIDVAGELHDGPIQRLAALGYELERVRLRLEEGMVDQAVRLLGPAQVRIGEEVQSLRRTMSSLRPPVLDQKGLQGALADQVASFRERSDASSEAEVDPVGRLPEEVETALYRVTQEALQNVTKHAKAGVVRVRLTETDGLVELEVMDDGVGFDPGDVGRRVLDGHVGLASIREQVQMAGGSLEIRSEAGEGTSVRAVFPRGHA